MFYSSTTNKHHQTKILFYQIYFLFQQIQLFNLYFQILIHQL